MPDHQRLGIEHPSRKTSTGVGYAFVLFGILLGFLLAEISAQAYAEFIEPTRTLSVNGVPDPRLGVRPSRTDRGIDARGWRNASALDAADIVVLGDSIEYGYGVPPQAAWPQRLGRLLHRPVYQMAMGGYGPGQYLLLFNEAAALRPKVIIAAYYLGNDIWDAYSLAYHTGDNASTTPSGPLQALVSTDPKTREAIRAAEAIDPGLLRYLYLDCHFRRAIPDRHLQQVHNILTAPPLAPLVHDAPSPAPAISPIRSRIRALVNTSMAYRLFRRSLDRAANRLFRSPPEDHGPPFCIHFQDGQLKTVFTVGPRLIALDTTDPRIVEGERISLLAYQALAERCRRAGIHFYVAIILTKESAFRPRAEPLVGHEPYLRDLWEAESAARSRAVAFFTRAHVDTIETLAALQAPIASGLNPYREDWDGHPVELGHEAIARVVAERLHRDGFGPLP